MFQQTRFRRSTIARKPAFAVAIGKLRAELEASARDDFGEFGRRYFYDWSAFARDCILWPDGESLTDYQAESMDSAIKYHREAVRAPHGGGKTTMAALCCLAFALTREALGIDWKIPMMASNGRHLSEFLWPEIHKWARRLRWDVIGRDPFDPRLELQVNHLVMTHGRAFSMTSAQEAGIEGAHADQVLFMFDEAKAILDPFWDAAEGAFSGGWVNGREAYALAISTPGSPSGRFYDIHRHKRGYTSWHTSHWTLDRLISSGRVNQEWADEQKEKWGETHFLYLNRVLGEFAEQAGGVIPFAWIEQANERWYAWRDQGFPGIMTSLGADIGGGTEHSDKTVIARCYDAVKIAELIKLSIQDPHTATMETVGMINSIMLNNDGVQAIIDMLGIGLGVYNRLAELGRRVRGFIASWSTELTDRSGEIGFLNARSAAWYLLREMLEPESGFDVCLPPDDELTADLTTPQYKHNSRGLIQVESKESYVRRLRRSSDSGDAVIMAIVGPTLCDEADMRGGDHYEINYEPDPF